MQTFLIHRRFCCPHFAECRESIDSTHRFRDGTMSHVGHHYDLQLDDRPLRIVVVGQDDAPYLRNVVVPTLGSALGRL